MSDIYDRDGKPLTLEQWCELIEHNPNYKRVELTEVGPYRVSTVWLGLDHRFGRNGPPLIFETTVFTSARDCGEDCWRYTTEEDARAGHWRVVAEVTARLPRDEAN